MGQIAYHVREIPHRCVEKRTRLLTSVDRLPGCKPVSVPLRVAVIPLGQALLPGSSDLPESPTERAAPPLLFGLAPRGVYPARPDCSVRGALLPHLFTLTPLRGRYIFCGTFRRTRFERALPAVSRHVALWRPDFPPATRKSPGSRATARPAGLSLLCRICREVNFGEPDPGSRASL